MRKNNSQNPRKSSNRGHHSKKNSTEFNQEQENHIFAHHSSKSSGSVNSVNKHRAGQAIL